MPYFRNGSFYRFLEHARLPEPIAKYYTKQLTQTLLYIHSKHIVHLDIKPENLMIDDQFNLVFIDFAFSADLTKEPDA